MTFVYVVKKVKDFSMPKYFCIHRLVVIESFCSRNYCLIMASIHQNHCYNDIHVYHSI